MESWLVYASKFHKPRHDRGKKTELVQHFLSYFLRIFVSFWKFIAYKMLLLKFTWLERVRKECSASCFIYVRFSVSIDQWKNTGNKAFTGSLRDTFMRPFLFFRRNWKQESYFQQVDGLVTINFSAFCS